MMQRKIRHVTGEKMEKMPTILLMHTSSPLVSMTRCAPWTDSREARGVILASV